MNTILRIKNGYRLFVVLLSILLLPLVLLLLIFTLLQFDSIRVQLLDWGQQALKAEGINMQMSGLQGVIPINFGLEHLTIADIRGTWLELNDLRLAWRPLDLLLGHVHVEEFSLRRLALEHWPLLIKTKKMRSPEFRLPKRFPLIILDKFTIPSIAINATMLGEAMHLGLEGKITAGVQEGIQARLELHQLDQETTKISFTVNLDPNKILDVNLSATENSDLLKRFAKLPLTAPAWLQLHGRGPINKWPGELKINFPGILALATSLRMTIGETSNLYLEGTISPAAKLIKNKIVTLFGDVFPFAVDLQLIGNNQPVLRQLLIDTAAARLEARGEIDFAAKRLALDMGIDIADLTKLQPLTKHSLSGSMKLNLHGEGALAQPQLRITLDGKKISGGEWRIAELATQAQMRFPAAFHRDFSGIGVEISGNINGLEITSNTLRGLSPAVVALLGPHVEWKAKAGWQGPRQIRLESLICKGKELDLSVAGDIPMGDGTLALQSKLTLPRLEVLDKVGMPVKGILIANLNLTGTLQEPHAQLELKGEHLKYNDQDLQNLQARMNVDQLIHNPRGDIDLRLGPSAQTLGVRGNFARVGTHTRFELSLSAPATLLQGQLNLDLANFLVQGKLSGRINNLGALNYWTKQNNLKGTVDLAVDLTTPKTQRVVLHLNGAAIDGDFGRIDEIKTDLSLANARALSGIDLRLDAKGIIRGDQRLKSLMITAQGDSQQLDVNARVQAASPQDTGLDLDAQLGQLGQQQRVLLRHLNGTWRSKPFNLRAPAELLVDAKEVRLSHVYFDFAGAGLHAEAQMRSQDVGAEVIIDPLPLRLLAELVDIDIAGAAKATLRLSGTKVQPQLKLDVDVKNLQALGMDAHKLPLQVTAQAELIAGQFTADLGITDAGLTNAGLSNKPARITIAVPMRLTLTPWAFNVDEHAALSGSMVGEVDIGHLSRFFALDDQHIAGLMQAAIRLNGHLGNPNLSGNIRVSNGFYENGLSGTVIKDLNLDLQLAGQSLTIAKLSANDGGKGRIRAQGGLTIDRQEGGFHLDTQIDLDRATLVRGDNASATLGGHIALIGDQHETTATGTLSIIKSDIQIPAPGTPNVPKLEVRELPNRAPEKLIPIRSAKKSSYPVNLNIKVDIPARTFVRGRGLDSEWRGHLDITGTAQAPQVIGQLWIQRGLFDFLDRRFKIQEGIIDFHGDYPPVPNINLKADVAGREMLAILTVTGAATNPKLTLESQPILPQDEILARLLFDRESKDISVLQALKLAVAVRTLASGNNSRGLDLLGRTRDSLGLDTLDMEGSDSENKSVKAGKYLREDVYLEVESGLGNNASKVRVEKEISRQLSVETSVDQDSSSAFGINWKIDY